MRLKDRVAIITGSADIEGIGAAIVIRYAREGAKIVISDIRDGEEVVDALEKEGGNAIFVKADVSIQDECDAMVTEVVNRFGTIDILINNAAIYGDIVAKPFLEITTEEWHQVMAVNACGLFIALRLFSHT